ncbi:MAG TPA: glycosyltransferase family 4 protein [Thermoleophilaceae bacterium]|nr:glycosyltransferase family 4 protein [Thermoleophilaceae bacterium]
MRVAALGRELSRRHEVRHLTFVAGPCRRGRSLFRVPVTDSQSEYRRAHPLSWLALGASSRCWHGAPLLSGLGMQVSGATAIAPLFRWADLVMVEYPWQFRVSRRITPPATPCVYSSVNVETDKFRSWAEAIEVAPAVVAPWLLYIERAERHAIARADLVTTVSELDRETYIARFGADPDRTVVVPNGVDTKHFRPASPERRAAAKRELGLSDRPVVLFQAADMPANRAGLGWIRRLAAANERFTFLVAGSVAAPERAGGLVAVGRVPDMRPYLDAADIGICPIAHGGGTKLKLLECMAAGLPNVAFAEAIRGTAVRPGEHVLVVDHDARELLDALDALTNDPRRAASMGNAGRALVERSYDWAGIAAGLERALVALTPDRSGAIRADRPADLPGQDGRVLEESERTLIQ